MHGCRWRFFHHARVFCGSGTLERTASSRLQRESAKLSSSIPWRSSLPHSSSHSADINLLQSIFHLRKKPGPLEHISDKKSRGWESSFACAYTSQPTVEPKQPHASFASERQSPSVAFHGEDKEPEMNGNLKDEGALSGTATVQRVKSATRLARQNVNIVNSESDPLMSRPNSKSVSIVSPGRSRRSSSRFLEFERTPPRLHSFKEDVGHAAAETFLLTRLTFSLLRYLGIGYRWMVKFAALTLYAFFLMPGFVQVGYKYFFSKNIRRSIVYGDQPRNRLDLYTPENGEGPYPVVIFVTGGAWIIGYKAWGALLGMQLSKRGIMVCCTDYRNFPQGTISNMVEDITTGIGFVAENIEHYGGDRERIYIAGQSAGCHIASCAIVDQARIEIGQKEGDLAWRPSHFKGYLGLSGGYNLCELVEHFHKRGLYKRMFLRIMEGEESLPLYSPELAVRSEAFAPAVSLLPPIHLFHGTADYSIPYTASTNFGQALEEVGATAFVNLYPDKTHTDVFIQDPMRGGVDRLFEDFVAVINADDAEARADDSSVRRSRRLVPEFLLRWARAVSPF